MAEHAVLAVLPADIDRDQVLLHLVVQLGFQLPVQPVDLLAPVKVFGVLRHFGVLEDLFFDQFAEGLLLGLFDKVLLERRVQAPPKGKLNQVHDVLLA